MSCETADEVESWKASFLRAGVYPEHNQDFATEEVCSCFVSFERFDLFLKN
jgi:hypothetical protein